MSLITHSSLHFLIDCLGILGIGTMGTNKDRYCNEPDLLRTVAQLDLNNQTLGLYACGDLISFTDLLVLNNSLRNPPKNTKVPNKRILMLKILGEIKILHLFYRLNNQR